MGKLHAGAWYNQFLSTAGDAGERRGLGGGCLARFWNFSAFSASPREIRLHACGMM